MAYPPHQSPLYRLHSRKRLAGQIFRLPLHRLEAVIDADRNYRNFVRVTGEKQRNVNTPLPALRELHERLASLLNRIEKPDYLYSGLRGRSHLSNGLAHLGARRLVKLDIQRFYPSITRDRIWRFFADRMQCSNDVAALLARLSTLENSAPIGSPLSQILAFHVVHPMLDELAALAATSGLRFSCYVDDLSFSGPAAGRKCLQEAEQIVRRHGYEPHDGRCYGPGTDRLVTGLLLTSRGPRVPPLHLRRIEEARQDLDAAGPAADRLAALERLLGRLAAAAAIDRRFLYEIKPLSQQLAKLRSQLRGHQSGVNKDLPALHASALTMNSSMVARIASGDHPAICGVRITLGKPSSDSGGSGSLS